MNPKQKSNPEEIVQENLEYYNQRNIDGFMSSFSEDIALYTFPEEKPHTVGLAGVRKMYGGLFEISPDLHSTIIKRITFDNKVIDHESIIGRSGSKEVYELVLIYEVRVDKIYKITAIKKS